jgi:ribosomal protein S18 acetylase RimI-like enzyme
MEHPRPPGPVRPSFREAATSDIARLIDLSRRTIRASYTSFLGDDAVNAFLESGSADQYVGDNINQCIVIIYENEIVGYAVVKEDLIDLLMIDCLVHRNNLGTELLGHVERVMFRSYGTIRLESFEGNHGANAFYRKNGWHEVRRFVDPDMSIAKVEFQKSPPT